MSDIKLPLGWHLTNLGNIVQVIRGVTYGKNQSSTVKKDNYLAVIRANNIQDGMLDLNDLVYVESSLVRDKQKIKLNDVIVAMSSGSKSVVGKTARALEDLDAGFGAFCGILRPIDSIYAPIVGLFTSTAYYRTTVSGLSAGANINNLKPSHFDEILFPLAPLAEQKVIAEKLDDMLAKVERIKSRLERIPQILKQFRQSVLADAVCGKLTEDWRKSNEYILLNETMPYPSNWVVSTLGEALNYGKCLKRDSDKIEPKEWVLELEDIEKDSSRLLDKLTFEKRQSKSTKNEFKKGDVLYGKLRPYLNKVIIAEQNGLCTTEIIPISPNENLLSFYIFIWLKSPFFIEYVNGITYGVNMPRLGTDDGKAAPIVIPPVAEQKEITRQVTALLDYANNIEKQTLSALDKINTLSQSILSKAFRGDLTEQWREENFELITGENSAKALLERINEKKIKVNLSKKKLKEEIRLTIPTIDIEMRAIVSPNKIIKVKDAFNVTSKDEDHILSGQELLLVAGYPNDADAEMLERFYLDLRASLDAGEVIKFARDDGQDWFALTEFLDKK